MTGGWTNLEGYDQKFRQADFTNLLKTNDKFKECFDKCFEQYKKDFIHQYRDIFKAFNEKMIGTEEPSTTDTPSETKENPEDVPKIL